AGADGATGQQADASQADPAAQPEQAAEQVPVEELEGRSIVNAQGEDLGEIEAIANIGGSPHAIVAHGGFLGLGQDEVAIPLDRFSLRGDELVLEQMTQEELAAMPKLDGEYQQLASDQSVPIARTWLSSTGTTQSADGAQPAALVQVGGKACQRPARPYIAPRSRPAFPMTGWRHARDPFPCSFATSPSSPTSIMARPR